ncbi:MAG: S-layer homology domain-containing protein, partial [Syntrophomonadaceae bacterium]|nr:S-layer homology domain-containing protein [Syntrophomonadaceae bacterium]
MKLCRTGKASWYKVILIMLLWSALLAVGNPALAADKTAPVAFKSHFSDIPSTDANAIYVNFLIGRGIITGYPDGGYHPEEGLTRAQAATVIVKAAGLSLDPNLTNPFSDVSEDHWAQAYIAKAAQAKYISGMSDGSYHPDEKLTRAQAISLILRLSQQPLGGAELPATVTDIDSTHWAAPSVAVGIASGMVGLSADGKQYLPDSDFTRISLAHALGVLLTQDPGLYTTSMEGKLKTVEGSVTIQSAGSKSEIEVKTESAVKAGDIIKTGAKSSAELNYPDGSSMLLKENTQITIVESIGRKYLKIDGNEGTAVDWLDIKLKQGTMLGGLATKHETTKTENPVTNKTTGQVYRMGSQLIASMGGWELLAAESQQPPWYVASQQKKVKVKVDMPWGVAAVRGTFVAITVTPTGQSTVSCLTGDAEVTNGGTTVPLSGNQSTQVTQAAAPPPPPAPLPPAELQQFIQAQTWMAQTAQNMTQNQEVTAPLPPAMSGQTPPPAPSATPPAPTPSVQEIISQAVQTATSNSGSAPTSVTNSSDENNTTSKVSISAINNITGTAEVGVELTAGTLTPAGATVIYQWKICETVDGAYTDINGATTNKYTPVPGDTGKYIKVVASVAFVDIGLERNAFLYAGDIVMSDDPDDEIEQVPDNRNIRDILKPGQTIMVQVAKDPVGTKGARVTTHITLAGRTLVLMPTMDYVGVSRRIDKDEERQRLRKILAEIKPKGMGIIVRTASAGKPKDVFAEDLESIVNLYHEIEKKAAKRKAPALLHAEQSLLLRTVRDLLMKDIDR